MTADETGPGTQRSGRRATSAAKAYERRSRREHAVASGRLTRTGSPIAAAMSRVPFVATIILLLAAGIVGVLWLNTVSDATALQATASRIRQAAIKTDIEALQKDVNTLQDPGRLAAEANRLGLVPAGDSALLNIGADGKGTVIGTPTPVPGRPVAPLATSAPVTSSAPASTTSTATTAITTTPATTSPITTTPATTSPVTTTPVTTSRVTTTPATTRSPVTTPVNTASATTTPVSPKPAKSTAALTTTAPGQRTTTTSTGAGR